MNKILIVFYISILFIPIPSYALPNFEIAIEKNKIVKACEQLKVLEHHYSDNYAVNTEYFSDELGQTIDNRYFIERLIVVTKLQKYFRCPRR